METNVVLRWDLTNHVRWKSPVPGLGHSSPIVWGDRVFLTTGLEGEVIPGAQPPKHTLEGQEFRHPESTSGDHRQTLKVLCFAAGDGRLLWEQAVHDGRVYDDRHRKGAYAAPTQVTDGRHVVSLFGAEGLFCHDFSGRLEWKVDLGNLSTLGLGPGSSPLLCGSAVILQWDQKEGEGSFLQAWDLATGRTRWRTERRVSASWSTPLAVIAGGRTVIACSGSEHLAAYDPADGHELWRADGLANNAVPSPIASGDVVLFSAGYPKKRALAFLASGPTPGSTPHPLWEYSRGTAYVPSPVPWDNCFYLMTDSGQLTCLDRRTGKPLYESERLPAPAKFTASAVAVAGRLLLTAEDGRTFVIRTGPKFEVEATNPIGETVMASLAIANGRIYLRGEAHLFCIGS